MANPLPLTIDFGTLPNNGQGYTPQQLADRLGINGRIFTEQAFALFTTGATAPTSDTGPWAANGNTWYYWDSVSGSYVPFIVPPESLRYSVSATEPDPAIYLFWIELTGGGEPIAVKTYYSGAWTDVYANALGDYMTVAAFNTAIAAYSTTAQMNTAIAAALVPYSTTAQMNTALSSYLTIASAVSTYAPLASPALTGNPTATTQSPGNNTTRIATTAFVTAAVAAIPGAVAGNNIFKGQSTADQDIVFGGSGTMSQDVTLGGEDFDPDGNFGSSIFTAPANGYYQFNANVQAAVQAGSITDFDLISTIVCSSGDLGAMSNYDEVGAGNKISTGSTVFQMTAGQTVKLRTDITSDAAGTIRLASGGSTLSGYRLR